MVKKILTVKKAIPVGVRVIVILYYLFSALSILFALLFFFSPSFFSSTFLEEEIISDVVFVNILFIVVTSLINLGIVGIFIGVGLWKGQRWARDMTLVFSATGILFGIWEFIQNNLGTGIFEILYNLIVGLYLLLNTNAKEAFIFNERR